MISVVILLYVYYLTLIVMHDADFIVCIPLYFFHRSDLEYMNPGVLRSHPGPLIKALFYFCRALKFVSFLFRSYTNE